MILSSYMNNVDQFQELCAKAKASNTLLKPHVDEMQDIGMQDQGRSLAAAKLTQGAVQPTSGAVKNPQSSEAAVSNMFIIKRLIQLYMNPTMIPYRNLSEEYM